MLLLSYFKTKIVLFYQYIKQFDFKYFVKNFTLLNEVKNKLYFCQQIYYIIFFALSTNLGCTKQVNFNNVYFPVQLALYTKVKILGSVGIIYTSAIITKNNIFDFKILFLTFFFLKETIVLFYRLMSYLTGFSCRRCRSAVIKI